MEDFDRCVLCCKQRECLCVQYCSFHKSIYETGLCRCQQEKLRCHKKVDREEEVDEVKEVKEITNPKELAKIKHLYEELERRDSQLENLKKLHTEIVDTYQLQFEKMSMSLEEKEYINRHKETQTLEQLEALRMKLVQLEKSKKGKRDTHFSRRDNIAKVKPISKKKLKTVGNVVGKKPKSLS